MSAAPLSAKHLAVITGGASGIGLAAAKTFVSRYGMNVAIGDVSDRLEGAVEDLRALSKGKEGGVRVWGGKVDVSSRESVQSFQKKVQEEFPESPLTFLMANAGVAGASKASEWSENWDRVFNINGFGVINTVQCFLPSIKAHKQPAYIVNTGSKQGITTPPMTGCAYNASKAVVKVFTEQLAWEMRNDESTKQIHPKLLIPGWVFTGLSGANDGKTKPEGAWTAEQTVDFLLERLSNDRAFYILCPDNETPRETDLKRMQWNISDVLEDRPALSRWHDEYSDKFSEFATFVGLVILGDVDLALATDEYVKKA